MNKWRRPASLTLAGVVAVLAITGISLGVSGSGGGKAAQFCEQLVVPAYLDRKSVV